MTVKVYNMEGAEVGTVELKPDLFEIEPNDGVVHQYIVNLLSRRRQGNSATRTRRQVRGGGRKPWRQKGTGRARAGTSRSPLWRGGGTVFGPSPRLYGSKLPRQMKRLAIQSVFSAKAAEGSIRVLDRLELEEFKTKSMQNIMTRLELSGKKCLILDEGRNLKVAYSCRNLEKVQYSPAAVTNGYDVLNADVVLFTRGGLEKAEEVFS